MEKNILGDAQEQLFENDELFFGMLRGVQMPDSHDGPQKDISDQIRMAIDVLREQINVLESCLAAIEARMEALA
jgi:hypothetical protein